MTARIITYRDGAPHLLGTWTLANGVAACDSPFLQEQAEQDGLATGGPILYPKDGVAFIKALPIAYSGSYLRAELVP